MHGYGKTMIAGYGVCTAVIDAAMCANIGNHGCWYEFAGVIKHDCLFIESAFL